MTTTPQQAIQEFSTKPLSQMAKSDESPAQPQQLSPEPQRTADPQSAQIQMQKMLQEKLSPLPVRDSIRDDSSAAIPKRYDSVQIQIPDKSIQDQVLSPDVQCQSERAGVPRLSLPQNTTQTKKQHEGAQQMFFNRISDPAQLTPTEHDDTLTRMLDGLSEISHRGGDDLPPVREVDTPFVRSPNSLENHQKDSMPFKMLSGLQPSVSTDKGVGHLRGRKAQHSAVKNSTSQGNMPRLRIKKGLLADYKGPTSSEIKSSAAKKFTLAPESLNTSVVSENSLALNEQRSTNQALLDKGQQVMTSTAYNASTTGGQHEAQEQRRLRVMSFSDASDSESQFQNNLSYSQKAGNNLSFPRSNHSTNSGSDVDSQRLRRHRRPRQNSDVSNSSIDSNRIRFSTPNSKQRRQAAAQVEMQRRDFVHPYANQPTPFEKLQEICTSFSETSLFITYEVVVWILDKLWGLLINLLLLPIAILGLTLDKMRQWAKKCPRRQNRNNLIRNHQVIRAPNKKRNLQIVLDLDMTLVYCAKSKPDSTQLASADMNDYITVHNKEFGGDCFVYQRPHLREFLRQVSQLGTVSVFTNNRSSYADPIIDKLDPDRKIFKNRFYNDNCTDNGDGEILKDMRFLEQQVEPTAPGQAPFGQPAAPSFSQRLNQAIGVPIFGMTAFTGTATNVRNQGDIQLSRHLLQRLVIVDDCILTYNAYKNNTIRVSQWKANTKNDRALLDCLEIIQQLGARDADVSKDLQYIIDMTSMYKSTTTVK